MFLNKLAESEKQPFLDLIHTIAHSNGVFHDMEKEALIQYCGELGILYDPSALKMFKISAAESFFSEQSRKAVFIEAMAMAMADRVYHKEQERIMLELKDVFGFSDEYYESVQKWVNSINELYDQASNLI